MNSFLPNLPTDWNVLDFGDLMEESAFGPRFSGELYATNGNVATLRTTDISDDGRISYETMPLAQLELNKFKQHFLKKGDLVITRSGTCGIAAVFRGFPQPVLPGAFLIRIRLNPKSDVSYYRHFFNSNVGRSHILTIASGAVQQNINLTNLKKLKVPFPPLPTQQKIASILSTYDDLIENNKRRIKILEEMAQTIHNEWFVKFRFPGYENVKMVESDIGMIPEGWEVKKLSEVIELAYGKALKKENRVEGQIPVYGSSGVVGYHNELLVKGPGIIVGRKGNVGSVYWSDDDFYPIDTVFYVNSELSLYYVYYNLQTQNFINNDAAVPGLSRNQAYLLPFLVPSKEVLIRFEEVESSFFEQKNNLIKVNNNLRTTRDYLLPKLISGEIDVSELDIDVGGITA